MKKYKIKYLKFSNLKKKKQTYIKKIALRFFKNENFQELSNKKIIDILIRKGIKINSILFTLIYKRHLINSKQLISNVTYARIKNYICKQIFKYQLEIHFFPYYFKRKEIFNIRNYCLSSKYIYIDKSTVPYSQLSWAELELRETLYYQLINSDRKIKYFIKRLFYQKKTIKKYVIDNFNSDIKDSNFFIDYFMLDILYISFKFSKKYVIPIYDCIIYSIIGVLKSIKNNYSNFISFVFNTRKEIKNNIIYNHDFPKKISTFLNNTEIKQNIDLVYNKRRKFFNHNFDNQMEKNIEKGIDTFFGVNELRKEKLKLVLEYLYKDNSLEKTSFNDEVFDVESYILNYNISHYYGENNYENKELKELLIKAIFSLKNCYGKKLIKNQKVLFLRYGLLDNIPKTRQEVSEILNISKERVRQIEENSLNLLRHPHHKTKDRPFI